MSVTKSTWLLIAISLLTSSARSQAIPAATMAPRLAIFAEGSANTFGYKPDPAHYGNLYGAVIGGYLQTRPWLGLEARASFLESTSQPANEEHQQSSLLWTPLYRHSQTVQSGWHCPGRSITLRLPGFGAFGVSERSGYAHRFNRSRSGGRRRRRSLVESSILLENWRSDVQPCIRTK